MMGAPRTVRIAAFLLVFGVPACAPVQPLPEGAPGSLVVHMGGSATSFGGVSSSR